MRLRNPFIRNRADPHISLHDGRYHFTASVPEYDRIVLRRAPTLPGLAAAGERTLWTAPATGPACSLVWAPELHRIDGAWFVYFAAAPSRGIRDGLFQHRMYALRCAAEDPMQGEWAFAGQVDSGIDAFCLDATSFEHAGVPAVGVLSQGLQRGNHLRLGVPEVRVLGVGFRPMPEQPDVKHRLETLHPLLNQRSGT